MKNIQELGIKVKYQSMKMLKDDLNKKITVNMFYIKTVKGRCFDAKENNTIIKC